MTQLTDPHKSTGFLSLFPSCYPNRFCGVVPFAAGAIVVSVIKHTVIKCVGYNSMIFLIHTCKKKTSECVLASVKYKCGP